MKKPYRYEIQPNGDWHYFIKDKRVDVYDYRRAVEVFEHELRKQREQERDERLSQPKGAYITKRFPSTVYLKQLAASPQAYARKDPACGINDYRELDVKAKATGQAVNVWKNDQE